QQRGQQRAQQWDQHEENHHQDQRYHHHGVPLSGLQGVQVGGAHPTDQGVGSGDLTDLRAHIAYGVHRPAGLGVGGQHHFDQDTTVLDQGGGVGARGTFLAHRGGPLHLGDALGGRHDLVQVGFLGHHQGGGGAGVGAKAPVEGLLSVHGLDLGAEVLRLTGALGTELGGKHRRYEQYHCGAHPEGAGAIGDHGGDAAPEGASAQNLIDVLILLVPLVVWGGGPKGGAAAQGQGRGEEGHRGEHRGGDPDGDHGAQAAGGGQIRGQQAEQTEDDGSPGGQDGADDTPDRGEHGAGYLSPGGQFLPIAGHEQERVVGTGAHHQDEQDSLALAVEADQLDVRGHVDQRSGQAQGQQCCDDHQDRKQR